MDDATRRRVRNEVKQSRQLQVILAHAVLVLAFLHSYTKIKGRSASILRDESGGVSTVV